MLARSVQGFCHGPERHLAAAFAALSRLPWQQPPKAIRLKPAREKPVFALAAALTLKLQDLRSSRQDSAAQIEHLKRENERLKSSLQDSSDAPGGDARNPEVWTAIGWEAGRLCCDMHVGLQRMLVNPACPYGGCLLTRNLCSRYEAATPGSVVSACHLSRASDFFWQQSRVRQATSHTHPVGLAGACSLPPCNLLLEGLLPTRDSMHCCINWMLSEGRPFTPAH